MESDLEIFRHWGVKPTGFVESNLHIRTGGHRVPLSDGEQCGRYYLRVGGGNLRVVARPSISDFRLLACFISPEKLGCGSNVS